MANKTVEDVKDFWESNPLFEGESKFATGSREFFEDHRRVVIDDCFAGHLDPRLFPGKDNAEHVLDLGCGPGFWSIELLQRGADKVTSADLTAQAIALTEQRAERYGLSLETSQQNAEKMSFPDGIFSHVNCQGVIHHTPNTEACVREIARVLRPGGSALISVYYQNIFIRSWPILKYLAWAVGKIGGGLKGRGREDMMQKSDTDEIIRLYDGDENPIGKGYSRKQFKDMLEPHFQVEEIFYHFFPARALPFPMPGFLHRFLDRQVGFMIYAKLTKPKT